jgi:hypothetical protein
LSEEPYPFEAGNVGMSKELAKKIVDGKATCSCCGKQLDPHHWIIWERYINTLISEDNETIFCSRRCQEKWHGMSMKEKCAHLRRRIARTNIPKLPLYIDCVATSNSYINPEKKEDVK